jgi:hypothetical protein
MTPANESTPTSTTLLNELLYVDNVNNADEQIVDKVNDAGQRIVDKVNNAGANTVSTL